MLSSEKGFRISVNATRNILNVQAWGIWDGEDMELAENFREELQEKVKEVNVNGTEWHVWGDFLELRPRSREVCRVMGDGIMFAIKHGMRKVVHLES
jgi:hypothetical protein